MAKTWIETERQGPGRRYWFRTEEAANAFAADRVARGYHIDHGAAVTTVWVSLSKRRTLAVRAIQGGLEPGGTLMFMTGYDEPFNKCRLCGGVIIERLGERYCSSCYYDVTHRTPDLLRTAIGQAANPQSTPVVWRAAERAAVRITRQRARAARTQAAREAFALAMSERKVAPGGTEPSRSPYHPGGWTGD